MFRWCNMKSAGGNWGITFKNKSQIERFILHRYLPHYRNTIVLVEVYLIISCQRTFWHSSNYKSLAVTILNNSVTYTVLEHPLLVIRYITCQFKLPLSHIWWCKQNNGITLTMQEENTAYHFKCSDLFHATAVPFRIKKYQTQRTPPSQHYRKTFVIQKRKTMFRLNSNKEEQNS